MITRKEKNALIRKHKIRAGVIGSHVWEQSGIGPKNYANGAWLVTNAAINEAVKVTYKEGISDEEWIAAALSVYKEAWRQTEPYATVHGPLSTALWRWS